MSFSENTIFTEVSVTIGTHDFEKEPAFKDLKAIYQKTLDHLVAANPLALILEDCADDPEYGHLVIKYITDNELKILDFLDYDHGTSFCYQSYKLGTYKYFLKNLHLFKELRFVSVESEYEFRDSYSEHEINVSCGPKLEHIFVGSGLHLSEAFLLDKKSSINVHYQDIYNCQKYAVLEDMYKLDEDAGMLGYDPKEADEELMVDTCKNCGNSVDLFTFLHGYVLEKNLEKNLESLKV